MVKGLLGNTKVLYLSKYSSCRISYCSNSIFSVLRFRQVPIVHPSRLFSCRNNARLQKSEAKPQSKPPEKLTKGIPYEKLSVGVPKEIWKNERRVAVTPAVASTLCQKGFKVHVEDGAGAEAQFRNEDYEKSGAKITTKDVVYKSGRRTY